MEKSTSIRKEKYIISKIQKNIYVYTYLCSHIHIMFICIFSCICIYRSMNLSLNLSIKVGYLIQILCTDEISFFFFLRFLKVDFIREGYVTQF